MACYIVYLVVQAFIHMEYDYKEDNRLKIHEVVYLSYMTMEKNKKRVALLHIFCPITSSIKF